LHTQVAALTAAPGVQANTKTHALLSTMIGLFLRAKEKIGYQPGSAIDKTVAEAIEHLKDWPYPEIAAPAQPAAPQGAAYVENPAEIEHVAGDVSKNRAESNMKGGAYAELPDARAMAERLMGWKLPADFAPDCYISFDRERATASGSWPIGTNLLTVAQAEAMFAYVLGQDPVGAIAGAFQTSLAHAADLKDAFAEVAHAVNRVDEAVYATLPAPNLPRGGFPDLFTADQMNAHADATHALRASHGQAPVRASYENELEEVLRERDDADDFIDALLDEVLGSDRSEWSSAYGRAEALEEVRERITALHKPTVDRAWTRFEAATAQPAPAATPQADSQPAPVAAFEVADAIADSQYLAGVSAGWNAANADDPNAALQKLHESRAGYLKPLSAARAPADSVLEDAARYDWLFGARTDAQVSSEISTVFNPLPQDEVISHLQGFYMSKSEVNALVDAARKQGANHD
ncbi:MAG TPA: hypothetical protein VMA55_09065, partial [Acidovorax sp.]|nr:hypothetical protein [Acidovorax sp.]